MRHDPFPPRADLRGVFIFLVYPAAIWALAVHARQEPPPADRLANAVLLGAMLGLVMERLLPRAAGWPEMGRYAGRAFHGAVQGIAFGVLMALVAIADPVAGVALGAGLAAGIFGLLAAGFWRLTEPGEGQAWQGLGALVWPAASIAAGAVGAALGGRVEWLALPAILALAAAAPAGTRLGRLRAGALALLAGIVGFRASGLG